MNKRGQALIEFVLILPVLIMLIFSIIDFGNIIITKNQLENKINDAVETLKTTDNYDDIYKVINKGSDKKIDLLLNYDNTGYLTISVEKKVSIITPGLNLVLGNPYKSKAERIIKYVK